MKKSIFASFLLSLMSLAASAQTTIEGTVTDSLGKAMDAVITIAARGASTNLIGYADTDDKGQYKVTFHSTADSLAVVVSGMSIGRMVKVVKNRSQRVDFRVSVKNVELKEVSVKADKIWEKGDTLNYNVAAYQNQGDRVIGDVLKKMPGIEVGDNGAIKFNGKAIKKFYVEDMDLLQGRYGLATNNINAKDVACVQVLQNHQPIKALQGKGVTDDVAINLKLKNSAKGTVAVNTMAGTGGQAGGDFGIGSKSISQKGEAIGQNPLWTAEAVGMYFSRKRQNMSLYKGNNTGDDVSAELASHYSSVNSVGLYPFCPTGAVMPSGSGLPMKRTFDNHSHIATLNHLEKLDSVREMTFNAAYHNDHVRREGSSQSDIFLAEDSRLLASETLTSLTTTNNLSSNLRYCKNASNGFLANVVKVDAGWNADETDGQLAASTLSESCSCQAVSQRFRRPTLSLSNTTNTIRDFGRRTLDLHFSAGYSSRNNTLSVAIDSLEESVRHNYEQDIQSQHIAANIHTNFSWRFGDFTLSYGAVADASLHGITTDLQGFTPPDNNDTQNDIWYDTYTLRLGQHYKWEHGRWRMNLGCPIELYTQSLDDRLRRNRNTYTHVLLIPSYSAGYYWRDWSGGVNADYQRTVGDPGGIYDGYIMSNYRSFQRSYVEQMSETDRVSAGANVNFRSAINAFFFNVSAGYTHTRDNQIYGYTYQGATSVVQAVNRPTTADAYNVKGDISKGFDWRQSSVRAFGGWSDTRCERLVSGKAYLFHSRTISLGAGGTITPLPWLNVVLSSGYSCTFTPALSPDEGGGREKSASSPKVTSATQRLKVNVFVTNNLTLAASFEDNYNNLSATQRHAWFGDAQAKYKFKRVDLELEVNNIFNQKTYTRVNYSALDIYTTTSQLRPLNVLAKIRFKLL